MIWEVNPRRMGRGSMGLVAAVLKHMSGVAKDLTLFSGSLASVWTAAWYQLIGQSFIFGVLSIIV